MTNKIDEVVSTLGDHKAYLGPLTKYPSKIKNDKEIEDKSSKGGKFIAEEFGGEKNGNYFTFHKKDIADEIGKVLTIEEIQNKFSVLLPLCLYSGEGNLLDRIGKQRGRLGIDKPHPVAFWRLNENIPLTDIYVLSFATGGTKKERQSKYETPCHSFCEENRPDGKRFALAEYSASNGENGTKSYTVDNEIMGIANLGFEEAMAKYDSIQSKLNESRGRWFANNVGFSVPTQEV